MKIVPSADIGDLGTKEGSEVVYNWKWYYNVPALALWVLLILAIVFVKANRRPQALLILVPLLVVSLLWSIFKRLTSMSSSGAETFDMLFYSLAVGIAVLWLLGHKVGNRNRLVTLLLAFTVMAVVSLIGVISYSGMQISQQSGAVLIFLTFMILSMLLGFVLTCWKCRKSFSALRFMLYFALWIVVACVFIVVGFYSIMLIIGRASVPIKIILLWVPLWSAILGVVLYVVIFPYMILAFHSSFFRERLFACLNLKPVTIAAEGEKKQLDEISAP
ncbi:MAG: hypothetical protein A2173_05750 [Planctomycetes bacterium RBG_13_44_8b]|nr:MAG: hypothetical protein A2173_05750 [Planctomycetes bacterium RBG_13_44_8b]